MATLINGNGNPRIYAAQDADLIAALAGDITGIAQIGNKFAATAVDANTISVADGVIVTKEGRRIQLDAGSTDMFVIPTGTTGLTNYYIIGYKLTTQSDDSQIAETFVQLMSSSSETITEDTFREGATDVYVSLYRVQQNGVNLGTITGLLPELTNISELKSDLEYGKLLLDYTPISDTYRSAFNHIYSVLHSQISFSENVNLKIRLNNLIIPATHVSDGLVIFTGLDQLQTDGSGFVAQEVRLSASNSVYHDVGYHSVTGWASNDYSNKSASGVRIRVYC
jgi:hypothetical protein